MSRREILSVFKKLQRITQNTFQGDQRAILEARQQINTEFRKDVDEKEIPEKLKVAKEVGDILKHQVVQAVKSSDDDKFGEIYSLLQLSKCTQGYHSFFQS